jgi:hypothetical protein
MSNKLKSALIGGLIAGVLSAIPIVNYCCCIWGIGGGAVAGLITLRLTRPYQRVMAQSWCVAGVVGAVISHYWFTHRIPYSGRSN